MKFNILFLLSFCFINPKVHSQIGRLALSPFQKIEQKIGLTDITITCSRPSQRGRLIFGGLVPYHKLWRTGANRNTTIAFSEEVSIGDQSIAPGKYAIFTIPKPQEWEIIFYKETDYWDVPKALDTAKIAVRFTIPSITIEDSNPVFSMSIGQFTAHNLNVDIEWENTKVSIPIKLNTAEQMKKQITKQLAGPNRHDYYLAALYEAQAGSNAHEGLQWINKAIEMDVEEQYWLYDVKSQLLKRLGKKEEAREVALKGLRIVKAQERQFMIDEFEKFLKQL